MLVQKQLRICESRSFFLIKSENGIILEVGSFFLVSHYFDALESASNNSEKSHFVDMLRRETMLEELNPLT